jgi:predicted MFS family arabinose efflux permease
VNLRFWFRFIFLAQVGVALSYAIWAVSHNFMLFVVARIISGLSKGNISVSVAVVADVTTPEKRSKGMVRT